MSINILPDLQRRLGVNWTPDEIDAEKELCKIVYGDTNIDLENLNEHLNESVKGEKLFENYLVKRYDFIALYKLGNPATTLPSDILKNLETKNDERTRRGKGKIF